MAAFIHNIECMNFKSKKYESLWMQLKKKINRISCMSSYVLIKLSYIDSSSLLLHQLEWQKDVPLVSQRINPHPMFNKV